MMLGKIVFLLVLAFAITCQHQQVAGAGNCTKEQKEKIMKECWGYISKRHPGVPETWSICCQKVKKVRNSDMDCIVDLLDDRKKRLYGKRIQDLKLFCAPPRPYNNQVNNINCLNATFQLQLMCKS
ncbi:hypothetical protein HU200_029298 [Digitaria exilis]|uniref:Bifunctional inhibitor/plant lipid transfer protein/seed storage helical domain-containing protein n=1 Tax=Digitaria exilis TaxID=1010633 RepID=A0A835BTC1_9POAL|nr:hypothetical protein HU200_029298 [Digitaria exilis]